MTTTDNAAEHAATPPHDHSTVSEARTGMTRRWQDRFTLEYLSKLVRFRWATLRGGPNQQKPGTYALPDIPKANLWTPEKLNAHSWMLSLNDPVWHAAERAEHMRADDPVLGVFLDGRAWALPWWIMKNHHFANLHLAGRPVLVGLCEMCSSAAAFHAVLDGQLFTYAQAGQYNGSLLAMDAETRSYWAPWSGEALTGTYKGRQLERLPLYQSRWDDWLRAHPTTDVLYADAAVREGHGSEFSPGSAGIGKGFRSTLLRPLDERLPHNTLVLGVEHGGRHRAYVLDALSAHGAVMSDQMGDEPLVVLHTPGTLQALAFGTRLDGDVLSFGQDAQGEIVDATTGSRWAVTGTATAGPLQGRRLAFVPSGIEEWYVWAAYHPDTDIIGAAAVLHTSNADQSAEVADDHH